MKKILALLLMSSMLLAMGCQQQTAEEPESQDSENYVFSSDDAAAEEQTKEIFAMDTYMNLKAYGSNAEDALNQCEYEIKNLEGLFAVKDSSSDIYKINLGGGSVVEVSDDTAKVITKALEFSEKTDGALDITIYPVLKEWGFTTGEYQVPDESKIKNLLQFVDYHNINVNGNNVNIPEAYAVDLGSVAKGYTSDKLCEILKNNGITSAIINLGGNVQTVGTKPDGSKWNVGIQNPQDSSSNICTVRIADRAVITSGNYERYFEQDGKKYWHIIDPKTGYPAANGIISSTIIGESGTECDALSTALFVMGTDKAIEYCKNNPNIEAILVTDDMKIYITDGLTDSVTMTEGLEYTTIKRS